MMHHAMMHNAMMAGPMMANAQMMMMAANPYLNPMHPMHPFQHEFNVQHNYVTPAGVMNLNEGGYGGEEHDDSFNLRSEEHTFELQSPCNLVCRLLLEKKKHKT